MAIRKRRSTSSTRTSSQIDFMKAAGDIGKPLAAVAGFAVGKLALKKLSKNQAVKGLMGVEVKELFIPAIVGLGGLVGTQFTNNPHLRLGLIGVAGAGVEDAIKKLTGKTMLSGLEGLMGDEETEETDYYEIASLPDATQSLPAADIDIEQEIQASMSGAAEDFSMSDEPIGNTAEDFSMSDEPIGKTIEAEYEVLDTDPFAGDMLND